jgi:hypothetical protein
MNVRPFVGTSLGGVDALIDAKADGVDAPLMPIEGVDASLTPQPVASMPH